MKKPQKPVHRGTSGAAKGGGRKGGGKRHRIGGGAGVVAGGGSAAAPVKRKPAKGKGGGKKGSPSGAKVHPHHHHPKRKLAIGSAVACCSAEALAASLRLAGWPVTDADVLALYWRTASDPDEGASILATLQAAQDFGLAGKQLVQFGTASSLDRVEPPLAGGFELGRPERIWHDRDLDLGPVRHGLIVGLTLPGGPHALTLDPSGAVWSWGELHDPAELLPGPVEEAWEVRW